MSRGWPAVQQNPRWTGQKDNVLDSITADRCLIKNIRFHLKGNECRCSSLAGSTYTVRHTTHQARYIQWNCVRPNKTVHDGPLPPKISLVAVRISYLS